MARRCCGIVTVIGSTSGALIQGTLADVNGIVFFDSDNGLLGNALWKTDGTPEGTVMVKAMPAICCGPGYENTPLPLSLTAVNDTLFFITGTQYSGTVPTTSTVATLWKSDGTDAGTVVVKPDANFAAASLTNVNGVLLFTGLDLNAGSGNALWQSDGTDAGTVEIASLGSVGAQELTNVNGTLFFNTYDAMSEKLWKSNGTAGGTIALTEVCNTLTTTTCGTGSAYLTNVNGTLFYVAQGGLWKSDGTVAGTVEIASGISPSDLAALNGGLYFEATDSTNGRELWKSDGTTNGTALVKDICPGTCSGLLPSPNSGIVPGPIAGSPNLGSGGDTNLISVFIPAPVYPRMLIASNGRLFFMACEPVNQCEPWSSDGTAGGTSLLKNVMVNTSSEITDAFDVNGTLLFPAFDGTSNMLWKSDGTALGTAYLNSAVTIPYKPGSVTSLRGLGVFPRRQPSWATRYFSWVTMPRTAPSFGRLMVPMPEPCW